MKIVYSWLKDFVDIDIPVEELADALTSVGLEVAAIERHTVPDGIVIARILSREKHPQADRLSVCLVDCGGDTPLSIVCGAPNAAAGMTVPLATIGTCFGPDFTVKKAKLRGVESFGMLCSEKELGISDDNSGLMKLDNSLQPGIPYCDYFPNDYVIEIEITPDRGDCLSMLGVAREIAARFGLPLKDTAKKPVEDNTISLAEAITVTNAAPDRCPRYTGRLVRNVTIGPSPSWLQLRLTLAGVRPINNVVDSTNYMLLHFGQPMHAFDYNQLDNKKIEIREAGALDSFTTLDSIERKLLPNDLLICDAAQPVALAGIMGGKGSEISAATTDVFLECAFFEQTGIRKTAKRLTLATDSSYRFERGVDPGKGLTDALNTAATLLAELAGGTVATGMIDLYEKPMIERRITVRTAKVATVLGIPVSAEQVQSFLTSLSISCCETEPGTFICTVPLFRHDCTIEEDLIEEIGRLYGYDNIPATEVTTLALGQELPVTEQITDAIRNALAFNGLHEVVTNSMTSDKKCTLLSPEKIAVKILNPLNPEMACMRTTLVGSLLEVVAHNRNRKNGNNRLFELGKTYERLPSGETSERTVVALMIEGNYFAATWNSPAMAVSIYILKGILAAFANNLRLNPCTLAKATAAQSYFGTEVAACTLGTATTGHCGIIAPEICKAFSVKAIVYYAELDVTELIAAPLPLRSYKRLPRFPALERDFSFIMPEELSSSSISETITALSPLVEEVSPFDLYRGEKLGSGKKSVTFNIKFQSAEKTLTDNDVDQLCSTIITTVASKHGAELRT